MFTFFKIIKLCLFTGLNYLTTFYFQCGLRLFDFISCPHMSKTHLLYTSGLDQQRTCNHSTLKCKSYIPLYHRNPDGDKKPWCFIKKDKKLRWDHCSVRKCPTPGKTDNKVTVWFIICCFSIKSSNSITLTYSSSMAFRVT